MWNYSPDKSRGAPSSQHVDQQPFGAGLNLGIGIGNPNPNPNPNARSQSQSQSQQQQHNVFQRFGMASPSQPDHSPVAWGQQEDMGDGGAQGQEQGQDVEMEDSNPAGAGVGNLIAHFENNINKTRKPSKSIHVPGGAQTGFGRVTSPTIEQFQSHARVRGGSIGRPPPVRFGTMGSIGHGGMRVASPVTSPSTENYGSKSGTSAGNTGTNTGVTPFGAMRATSMSASMQTQNENYGSTPSADAFGSIDGATVGFGNAGDASSPFGFGNMGRMSRPMQNEAVDNYGMGSGQMASPLVETPASPFGAFDFSEPRVASPMQSPSIEAFGNVDDLARMVGSATSPFGTMNQDRVASPMQSPANGDFGHMGTSTSMGTTFVNTSVSAFQNLDPFKAMGQMNSSQNSFEQTNSGPSRGGRSFGHLAVPIKQENPMSNSSSTHLGGLNTVAENNSATNPTNVSNKDFRPPLPPRKTFLHQSQSQNQNQTQNQGQNQQTHNTSPSTPGFSIWKPPVPTTPKPIMHSQQQPAQQQQQSSNMSYFRPSSKMDLNIQTDGQPVSQHISSAQDFIKSEPPSSVLPSPVTNPSEYQQTTFSIQNPGSVSLRSQGARPTREQVPAEAWESYKPTIRQLYLEERRPLKEVIQLMAERHGFQATPKMYKTRFSQWGFVKNNTEEEVKRLLSMKFQRDAKGKVSEFVRNGRVINLGTYLKRKGVTEYDLVDFETPADLPSYVRCRTPTPPPAPGYLRSPDLLRAQETVVGNMRKAFLHCRQSELDTNTQVGWATMMLWGAGSSDLLYEANKRFERQESDQGGHLLIEAFKQLEVDLKKLSPQGIKEVLLGMVHRDPGMMTALSKYLAAYSTTNFERSHPLRQIFTTLYEVQQKHGPVTLSDLVWGCIPTIADELEAIYGRRHPYVARTWLDLAAFYGHADSDRLQKLVSELQPLRRAVEAKEGRYSAEDLALRYTIVQLLHAAAPESDQTKAEIVDLWNAFRESGEAYLVRNESNTWCFHDAVKVSPWNKRCKERYGAIVDLLGRYKGVHVKMYFEEEMHVTDHAEDDVQSGGYGGQGSQRGQGIGQASSQSIGQQSQNTPISPQDAWAAAMDMAGFGGGPGVI